MLDELGIRYGTDKSSKHHDYCKVYEHYFMPLKDAPIVFVEIGIGGYEFPDRGGESLRMWNAFFANASINGIDIHPKNFYISERVQLYFKPAAVDVISNLTPDIIIDDGSHINAETITNFKQCFPYLKSGGFYCIEDVHCSYWEENFAGNPDPESALSTMGFFIRLAHQLNDHVLQEQYKTEYAGQFEFVHFYKEMIIIKKAALKSTA